MLNKKIKNSISFGIIFLLATVAASMFIFSASNNLSIVSMTGSANDSAEIFKEKFVTLKVLNQSYEVQIKNGDTVYDVMQSLNNSIDNFSFKGKEYSGLGVFVTEINGIKGKSGSYWIYYINNKEASIGISKYILKSRDVITWKQNSNKSHQKL